MASSARMDIAGRRADGLNIEMNDIYCAITRGPAGGSDTLSCSAYLSSGDYEVTVNVRDQSGDLTSTTGFFSVAIPVTFTAPTAINPTAHVSVRAATERYVAANAALDLSGTRDDGVSVNLDQVHCAITRGSAGLPDDISCPVFLSDGRYIATLRLLDQNGALITAEHTFDVSLPFEPPAPIVPASGNPSSIEISMERYVAMRASMTVSGALHDGVKIQLTDQYCAITRGAPQEPDIISCPLSLQDGEYHMEINTWDENGYLRSAGTSLNISLKPLLSLQRGRAFWSSYQEYRYRQLTVLMHVVNTGPHDAMGVRIIGDTNTNGVTLASLLPLHLGDVPAGSVTTLSLKYYVPEGVSGFSSQLRASGTNSNGSTYNFPA